MRQIGVGELFRLINKMRDDNSNLDLSDPNCEDIRQELSAKYNMIYHALWCQVGSEISFEDRICHICKKEVFQKYSSYCGNCGQLLIWVNKK